MSEQTTVQKFLNHLLYNSHPFFGVNCLAILIFLFLRAYELFLVSAFVQDSGEFYGYVVNSLFFDLFFVASMMVLLSLLYFAIGKLIDHRIALRIHLIVLLLLFFLAAGLTQYFSVTLVPLSSDLFGYSWNDIRETIRASGGITIGTFIVFLAAPVAVFFLPSIAKKFAAPKMLIFGFYGFSVVSVPIMLATRPSPADFEKEVEYYIVENKTHYFLGHSFKYFFDDGSAGFGGSEKQYPLLRTADYTDVIGNYFTVQPDKKPNIVLIIVEGLGGAFVEGGTYQGFTPFLDSITKQSLYWRNFLSTTGRTFGVLPALTASLPFDRNGFMELGTDMPDHRSLFTLLKANGYRTSYYYGGKISFDKQNLFLERQEVDNIVDAGDFSEEYTKSPASSASFSWGYADDDLFKHSFEKMVGKQSVPRLDVYMTLSTHEPFNPPNKEYYKQLFYKKVAQLDVEEEKRGRYKRNADVFSSIFYTDDAIRNFISEYSKRDDFVNTIFMITGDHRLIPVPYDSKLDRYHVPFIIYSPMLNHVQEFRSVSTHADVVPTLLGFLAQKYRMNFPVQSHWVGMQMDTAKEFRNLRSRAFMHYKGEISDYIDGKYFLAGDRLYELRPSMYIEEIRNDSVKNALSTKRGEFIALCNYVNAKNRIYPVTNGKQIEDIPLNEDSLFALIDQLHLNSDQLFIIARDTSHAGYIKEAQLICRRLLAINPDYHDVRTLLARTLAWEHNYTDARNELLEVIRRAPEYADAYTALGQLEFWNDNYNDAFKYINRSISMFPNDLTAQIFKAKMLYSMGRDLEAMREVNDILARDPKQSEASDLKEKIEALGK